MDVNQQDVQHGMSIGLARVDHHFKYLPHDLSEQIEADLKHVFAAWSGTLNGRFVQLFAEMTTIAAASRAHYEEAPLSKIKVRVFLGLSVWFFNSFTHK